MRGVQGENKKERRQRLVIDIEPLLAEAAEEPPCGPNLEYDAAFLELEQSTQGRPEQQFGETVIPAEEPAWGEVQDLALSLLQRSKDLRIAVPLTRALVNLEGVAGLNAGLKLIHEMLLRYWDHVHPQLDAEDDNDPTMRLNSLAPLIDADTLLRDLRKCPFLRSRSAGQVLVRDVEVALGKLPPPAEGGAMTQDQVESIARVVAADSPGSLEVVREAAQTLRSLHGLLVEKVGGERALDVRPMASILTPLVNVCNNALAATGSAAVEAEAGAVEGAPGSAGAPLQVSGEIRSRDDAIRLLEKVCAYLERTEPTNPAPLLIQRAKRLMTMSFVDIIRDMAPDSVSQVETIAGIREG